MKEIDVNYKNLKGIHILSGVDMGSIRISDGYWNEDAAVLRFILDDKTYKAIEDPSDGYRSTLGKLIECDEIVSNMFIPHKVIGKIKKDNEWESSSIIQFFDFTTKDVVLEIDTDHNDDYYPSCVMNWYPENLYINRDLINYNM